MEEYILEIQNLQLTIQAAFPAGAIDFSSSARHSSLAHALLVRFGRRRPHRLGIPLEQPLAKRHLARAAPLAGDILRGRDVVLAAVVLVD